MQLGQHDALKPYETLSRLMAATKRCLNSFEHFWKTSDPSKTYPTNPVARKRPRIRQTIKARIKVRIKPSKPSK